MTCKVPIPILHLLILQAEVGHEGHQARWRKLAGEGADPKRILHIIVCRERGNVGVLKIHASELGAKPGVLGTIATHLSEKDINIKSVINSQTCISVLLDRGDMEEGYREIKRIRPRPYGRLEKIDDMALVGIVGKGMAEKKGIAARVFTAVANSGVNIEMISMGPSRAAYYFMVREKDLKSALRAVHDSFFGPSSD